jgi:hypothetical protein
MARENTNLTLENESGENQTLFPSDCTSHGNISVVIVRKTNNTHDISEKFK